MNERIANDGYLVEFIPLERRLNDRRNNETKANVARMRRKSPGRRATDYLATPQVKSRGVTN